MVTRGYDERPWTWLAYMYGFAESRVHLYGCVQLWRQRAVMWIKSRFHQSGFIQVNIHDMIIRPNQRSKLVPRVLRFLSQWRAGCEVDHSVLWFSRNPNTLLTIKRMMEKEKMAYPQASQIKISQPFGAKFGKFSSKGVKIILDEENNKNRAK